jgi:hypothetical protein
MNRNPTGQNLLLATAAFTTVGGFLFDWNRTHLFNPRWTPHAKFHDAMTILLGSFLGAGGIYLLQKKGGDQELQLKWGTLLPAFFWTAQAGSFAFPGAKGLEAEFPELIPRMGPIKLNEAPVSLLMLTLLGVGYLWARKSTS